MRQQTRGNSNRILVIVIIILALALVFTLGLLLFKDKLQGQHEHSYVLNQEGTWACTEDGDVLDHTDEPYLAIYENGQPSQIVLLKNVTKKQEAFGNATIYKADNVLYYLGGSAQEVILKTAMDDADSQVIIDAKNDVVRHYGSASVISIDAVGTDSYHEYGSTELLTLTCGRVVLEENSNITKLYLDTSNPAYSYDTVIIALRENVSMPELSRDGITLTEEEIRTIATVQMLKDEVVEITDEKTKQPVEVTRTVVDETSYIKLENVKDEHDELIVEAYLSETDKEDDDSRITNGQISLVSLEEAKAGSTHAAAKNVFTSKDAIVNSTRGIEEQEEETEEKQEESQANTDTSGNTSKTETKKTETKKTEETKQINQSVVYTSHTHSYATTWSSNASGHWHNCSVSGCTATKDFAAHTYGTDGEQDDICSVCGYTNYPSGTEIKIWKSGAEATYMTLAAFRDAINAGTSYSEYTVSLVKNVSLSGKTWTPIGTATNPFTGTFDGKGYTISGLTISSGDYVGLFGYTGNADIKNFTVTGTVSGTNAAGLIGKATGDLTISHVTMKTAVNGTLRAAGFIGSCDANVTINNSTNEGTIIATNNTTDCAGGFIAGNENSTGGKYSINNCVNKGTVTGYAAGAIVGYTKPTKTQIKNCDNLGTISSTKKVSYVHKLYGDYDISDSSTEYCNITCGVGTYHFDLVTDNLVELGCVVTNNGNSTWTVTENHETQVITADGTIYYMTLDQLRTSVNSGTSFKGQTLILQKDIDLYNVEWTPIGTADHPFEGTFDGNGKTIKNLKIQNTSSVEEADCGLFGYVYGDVNASYTDLASVVENNTVKETNIPESAYTCVIKNLTIENANISTNERYIGALAGRAFNAYISGITIKNATVSAEKYAGGVIGASGAIIIKNCSTDASTSVTTSDHSAGGIISGVNVAYNAVNGSATGTYTPARSDSHKGAIIGCVNNATVTGGGIHVGGILGHCSDNADIGLVIDNCVNNGLVTSTEGIKYIAGISGSAGSSSTTATVFISNCENNGEIKANASSVDSMGGICDYLNGTVYSCTNRGTLTGYVTNMGGICGGTSDGASKIITNCVNSGTLNNTNTSGKSANIVAYTSGGLATDSSNISSLTNLSAKLTEAKYYVMEGTIGETSGTLDTGKAIGLEIKQSMNNLALTLGTNENKSVELKVNNATITLSGNYNQVNLSVIGSNNTVNIPASPTSLKSLTVSGSGSKTVIDGTIVKTVALTENASSITVNAGANVGKVFFGGTGTYSLVNHGTISNTQNDSNQYANDHTVCAISACTITIDNYGTIEAKENSSNICSYALLFYNNCDVTFNAKAGSQVNNDVSGYTIACGSANTVTINYSSTAKLNGIDGGYSALSGSTITTTNQE